MASTHPIYDSIGKTYSVSRRTDPRIAQQLLAEINGATRILNIGAGTGSYEPAHIDLVAVEPSSEMIAQRATDAPPVVQAFAEDLPFEDASFSHTMTVLSMHHWTNRSKAFAEINRVSTERFVAITWDPSAEPFWLTRDYFPEIYQTDVNIFPAMDDFHDHFDDVRIRPLMIPDNCEDGFLAAFWKRPDAYLSQHVRDSISSFSKIENLDTGLAALKSDLDCGRWEEKNHALLDMDALDVGYRLVTASLR